MGRKGERAGVWLTCPCGEQFYRWAKKAARSRCCSNACKYKYARRPSGMTYDIKVENRGWFEKGNDPIHKFPKGHQGGRQIKLGERFSPGTEFKKGQIPQNYKGDAVGYFALHAWVQRRKGKPIACEHCSGTRNVQWANKSREYMRDLTDWLSLCAKCHRKYDMDYLGVASDRYPELRVNARKQRLRRKEVACV